VFCRLRLLIYGLGRIWLSKFFEVLLPPYPLLGSPCNIHWDKVPDSARAVAVAKEWSKELVFNLDPRRFNQRSGFLTYFVQGVTLTHLLASDEVNPLDFVYRARCMRYPRPVDFIRLDGGRYILEDICTTVSRWGGGSLDSGLLFVL
jgi:hypothetical protein